MSFSEYPNIGLGMLAIETARGDIKCNNLKGFMNTKTTFEELLNDPSFRKWVYENRHQNEVFWDKWSEANFVKPEVLQQLRSLLLNLEGKPIELNNEYIDNQVTRALSIAKEREREENLPIKDEQAAVIAVYKYWAIAASVLLVLGIWWFFNEKKTSTAQEISFEEHLTQSHNKEHFTEINNNTQLNKLVVLPDGSTIVLHKGSRLKYYDSFNAQKREVFLLGEAFFEVTKNTQKPFLVFTKDIVTKVLGTSFTIKAFDDLEEVKVMVKTGRVAVITQNTLGSIQQLDDKELSGVVLTANQQIIYQRNDNTLSKTEIQAPPTALALKNEAQSLVFDATPVSEVFTKLEKEYGIDIVFDEQVMSKCTITAKLGTEPLNEKIKWICTIIDASYEITDGQIIISGKPCN